ncbi:hypothetical protein BD309DRAFT_349226 [Dichomitus squalens]|nr:hypothetical protein BD309DRAFT_349226 [Dichomitus squalens]
MSVIQAVAAARQSTGKHLYQVGVLGSPPSICFTTFAGIVPALRHLIHNRSSLVATMRAVPSQFNNPDDFAPVKRRPGRFYCKICTPSGYAEGQAMNLSAALHHEQHNEKHQAKVQERLHDEWFWNPPVDWGPTPIPLDSSPWEQAYPSERAEEFINHWLDNIAAAQRDEAPESMDTFIDRYNQKYQDWNDNGKPSEEECGEEKNCTEDVDPDREVDDYACKGIPGKWYDVDSFHPDEEGFDAVGCYSAAVKAGIYKEKQWRAPAVDTEPNMWLVEVDLRQEYLAWGFSPEQYAARHNSADTPPSQPERPRTEAQDAQPSEWRTVNRRKCRGRRLDNGGVQGQKSGIVDGGKRRPRGRRARRAKIV